MKTKSLLIIAVLTLVAPFVVAQSLAPATPSSPVARAATKDQAKAYPLKVCLVTGNDLDSMGDEVSIIYQGQIIKFCCRPCEKKFLRAPEKYLAKLPPQQTEKR